MCFRMNQLRIARNLPREENFVGTASFLEEDNEESAVEDSANEFSENQNNYSSEENDESVADSLKKNRSKKFKHSAKWLSGNWPLKEFDGKLEIGQRKVEWHRYKEQFKRVAAVKGKAKDSIKIKCLKIYAGTFLVDVMMSLERCEPSLKRNYKQMLRSLDKYFEQGCDKTFERKKFREMRMKEEEAFADWIIRLEKQAAYCEFGNQFKDEMLQALFMGSIKQIGDKLYESATMMDNDYSKIVALGNRLDQARVKATDQINKTQEPIETEVKPIMAVKEERFKPYENQYRPYRRDRDEHDNRFRSGRNWIPARRHEKPSYQNQNNFFQCEKCGRNHGPRDCPAFQKECAKCGKLNHFAIKCRTPLRSNQDENRRDEKNNFKRNDIKRINKVTMKDEKDSNSD